MKLRQKKLRIHCDCINAYKEKKIESKKRLLEKLVWFARIWLQREGGWTDEKALDEFV